jgi:hypothetical protein
LVALPAAIAPSFAHDQVMPSGELLRGRRGSAEIDVQSSVEYGFRVTASASIPESFFASSQIF